MKSAWIRILKVRLSSSKTHKQIEFGDDYGLKVDCTGHKYLSASKDEFVVKIYNLDYAWIVKLIADGYDTIEIFTGYKSFHSEPKRIFRGGILDISNDRDLDTNVCVLVCTSVLVARQNSRLLNLTLKSGINMYSALKYIAKKAGIQNPSISESLKNRFTHDSIIVGGNTSSVFDQLSKSTDYLSTSSDSSEGAGLNIYSLSSKMSRLVEVTPKSGLVMGRPQLTSDGLTIEALPTFNFIPGDWIHIDDALINFSFSSKSDALEQQSTLNQMDSSGIYIVWDIAYSLSNANGDFKQTLRCKSKSLMTGGLSNNG